MYASSHATIVAVTEVRLPTLAIMVRLFITLRFTIAPCRYITGLTYITDLPFITYITREW
jgi:hypothetical protein